MINFNGVIKRSIMRELSANVADAMRTSRHEPVQTADQVSEFGQSEQTDNQQFIEQKTIKNQLKSTKKD